MTDYPRHPSKDLLLHEFQRERYVGGVHMVVQMQTNTESSSSSSSHQEFDEYHWRYGVLDAKMLTKDNNNNDESIREVDHSTLFMINSTTKIFTTVAVLQLVQRGILSLEDSVIQYVPMAASYGPELRVRHLLNYSGGVPNPMPTKWFHLPSTITNETSSSSIRIDGNNHEERDRLQKVIEQYPHLQFPPGTKYLYSNLGWWLLGILIEEVSGQDMETYLEQNIRKPLGIDASELSFYVSTYSVSKLARGHQRKFQLLTFVLWLLGDRFIWDEPSSFWSRFQSPLYHNGKAYGGLFATPRALKLFAQDLLRPDPVLLSVEMRNLMWLHQCTESDGTTTNTPLGTTLGWMHSSMSMMRYPTTNKEGKTKDENVPYFSKPGGGPGFFSNLRIYPEHGIATILLVNATQISEAPIQIFSNQIDRLVILDATRQSL
jgi:CubicO group peptidase (beta-lactamase class C family)